MQRFEGVAGAGSQSGEGAGARWKPGQLASSLCALSQAAPGVDCPDPHTHCRLKAEGDRAQLFCGLTGENVNAFFSRVAALAFEQAVLQDLERRSSSRLQVGDGDLIRAYRQPGWGWRWACGLKFTSTILPSLCLGCPFSQHSDLRPAASLTPATSSDPLPAPLVCLAVSSWARLGLPGSTAVSWLWLS